MSCSWTVLPHVDLMGKNLLHCERYLKCLDLRWGGGIRHSFLICFHTTERAYLMVPVGEGSGLMRCAMLSGMLMVRGEIWGWTGLIGDSGTFLDSFLSLDRAVNVIFILVLGKRKQHLREGERNQKINYYTI